MIAKLPFSQLMNWMQSSRHNHDCTMSLTPPSSQTIHLAVRGLAGVLVDTSQQVSKENVRVYVRVLHNGRCQGLSPHSHPLRSTGDLIYSLQRHVAIWSHRNEKTISVEASTGQVFQLEICLKLPDRERLIIGVGEWVFSKEQAMSDVEIVCSLSEDKKESFPYRIDPLGDAVLRIAVVSSGENELKEERPLQDPPGRESKYGSVELSKEHSGQSPIQVRPEKSVAPKVEYYFDSPKKRVTFSQTKLETKFIIPADKRPIFRNLFGSSNGGIRKSRKHASSKKITTTTSKRETRATATIISMAPLVKGPFSPRSGERTSSNILLSSDSTEDTSFMLHESPIRKQNAPISSGTPRTPTTQQSAFPVIVSPDPPERKMHVPNVDVSPVGVMPSSTEGGATVHIQPDQNVHVDNGNVRSTSPVEFEKEQASYNGSSKAPVNMRQNETVEAKLGSVPRPEFYTDGQASVSVPPHSQVDENDQEGIASPYQEQHLRIHKIPETNSLLDALQEEGKQEAGETSPQSQPAHSYQVELMWKQRSPESSIGACDDIDLISESHSGATVDNQFYFLFSIDKGPSEEGGHNSWVSAKEDDQSFFTAGEINRC